MKQQCHLLGVSTERVTDDEYSCPTEFTTKHLYEPWSETTRLVIVRLGLDKLAPIYLLPSTVMPWFSLLHIILVAAGLATYEHCIVTACPSNLWDGCMIVTSVETNVHIENVGALYYNSLFSKSVRRLCGSYICEQTNKLLIGKLLLFFLK